jgi:tRNA threonylcarbamoyladenosine biosynthesis protein TsaE
VDLYRLDTKQQVATLGLEEILDREAVVLIEWAERFPQLFPTERIEIRLEALSESKRQLTINQ